MQKKFEFLDEVVDTVSGFTGKVTGYAEYLNGFKSYQITGIDSTGRPIEDWISENLLKAKGEE